MPLIDEREQTLQILKRYHKLESSRTKCLLLLLFFFIGPSVFFSKFSVGLYISVGMVFIWLSVKYVTQIARREFIAQMTTEELDLLARTSTVGFEPADKQAARELVRAYHKIHPKSEYLRASQQTQDKTLLRAAAYTDNAPQDQLLRPSQNDES